MTFLHINCKVFRFMMKDKMDIKMLKKYFGKLALSSRVGIVIFSPLVLYFTFLYFNALYNGVPIKYSSYQNVNVEVKEETMDGKLNQYITIKQRHKNKYCYVSHCGFPKEGHYHLSYIEFIDIDGDVFILKSCLNKEKCFYNVSDSFIKKVKEDRIQGLKEIIYAIYFTIFVSFIMGMDNAREKYKN